MDEILVSDIGDQLVYFAPIVMNQPPITKVVALWFVYVTYKHNCPDCVGLPRDMVAVVSDARTKTKVVRSLKRTSCVRHVVAHRNPMPRGTWLGLWAHSNN